jgi:hypothetical protein
MMYVPTINRMASIMICPAELVPLVHYDLYVWLPRRVSTLKTGSEDEVPWGVGDPFLS